VENQPTGHGPRSWLEKGPSASLFVSLRIAADMLLTHASHPDPFEANGMPPTYDSMHQCRGHTRAGEISFHPATCRGKGPGFFFPKAGRV